MAKNVQFTWCPHCGERSNETSMPCWCVLVVGSVEEIEAAIEQSRNEDLPARFVTNPAARLLLERYLDDPNDRVALMAARSLASLALPESTPRMLGALSDSRLQLEAFAFAARVNLPEGRAALVDHVDTKKPGWQAAAVTLGAIGDPRSFEPLLEAVRHADNSAAMAWNITTSQWFPSYPRFHFWRATPLLARLSPSCSGTPLISKAGGPRSSLNLTVRFTTWP